MLTNKQNMSSANNVFFQSPHASWQAWARNAQLAVEKLTELNLAAAHALAAESRAAAQQCLLADGAQALLLLALTQAQANVAKAHSYGRHLREIVGRMRADDCAEMKTAIPQLSVLADQRRIKRPVAASALTVSDSAHPAPFLAPLSVAALASGRESSMLTLAKFNRADVTEITEITEIDDAVLASLPQTDASGPPQG